MTLAFFLAGTAERHALVERHVLPDDRGLADHDTMAMINEEAFADLSARMDLDPGLMRRPLRNPPRPQIFSLLIKAMAPFVCQHRPE